MLRGVEGRFATHLGSMAFKWTVTPRTRKSLLLSMPELMLSSGSSKTEPQGQVSGLLCEFRVRERTPILVPLMYDGVTVKCRSSGFRCWDSNRTMAF